ncbi:IclR family transcriptional regulator [Planococcus shenhongbingii]|uniref:IclR family transcriptional regulator n=1 Tax=Planococcus shenhongbingii TaxID=3058398 RepID=UPI0026177BFF|nr:IclR family transcriptional regulator [Planococcus sp. N016]WKA59128.1 IclR family transcriptional regulator [Planococcus sp. N016]
MSSNSTIGSLALGIQIIDAVAQSDLPLKFSDIQEVTGISKSNLYKYLNTLTRLDLLYRDQRRGSYSLGYKFLQYGTAALQNADFIDRLTPYFKEISKITSMTTLFATWVNEGPIITNIWNTNYGLNIGAQVGTKLPLYSASGKIFAAYAHSMEMTNWIEQEQQAIENFDISKFQNEMKQIRNSQYTYAYEPLIRHVSSLGFPILNYKRELIGSFSVVGFSEDIPHESDSEIIQRIVSMSKEMSAIYGYKEKEE